VDDDVEVVQADDSVSMANVELAFWEYQGIDCFSGKDWGEGPVETVSNDKSRFKQSALIAIFNG
jgi:hypothetical protein